MVYRETEHVRLLKERTRLSIALATEGKWAEAAQLNREILEACPDNVPALNRLGRALIELGLMTEALEAFRNALLIDPRNDIAATHVARLDWAAESPAPLGSASGARPGLSAKVFTGDSGKSAEVTLLESVYAGCLSPGAVVSLVSDGPRLLAVDSAGDCLGLVPPRVARRLAALIAGGNRYDGAVSGQTAGAIRVVLRETFQHPSQRSKVSFPPNPEPEPLAEEPSLTVAESSLPVLVGVVYDDVPVYELVAAGSPISDPLFDDLIDDDDEDDL